MQTPASPNGKTDLLSSMPSRHHEAPVSGSSDKKKVEDTNAESTPDLLAAMPSRHSAKKDETTSPDKSVSSEELPDYHHNAQKQLFTPPAIGPCFLNEQDCASSDSARESLRSLGQDLPELEPYHNEPGQMPSGVVGKNGYLRLDFVREDELYPERFKNSAEETPKKESTQKETPKTILSNMDRRVPFLVQKALYFDTSIPSMACVTIITTTGCVIQGDRYAFSVHAGKNTRAMACTQSATKVHMMEANYAAQLQRFTLEDNAYFEYMPDPLILHRTSRYVLDTRVQIAPTATLLYGEVLIPGRIHHHKDELFGFDLYSSRFSASREPYADPLLVERFVMQPHQKNLSKNGIMDEFPVYANIFLLTPKEHHEPLMQAVGSGRKESCIFGISQLPNDSGLLFKVLGSTSEIVRAETRHFHDLVRRQILGVPLPEAYLWK